MMIMQICLPYRQRIPRSLPFPITLSIFEYPAISANNYAANQNVSLLHYSQSLSKSTIPLGLMRVMN